MDFSNLNNYIIPIVMLACLVIGYILKNWIKDCDNRIIPTALAVFGAALACVVNKNVTVEYIVYGAITGLASTGLHQAFKQWLGGNNSDTINDESEKSQESTSESVTDDTKSGE